VDSVRAWGAVLGLLLRVLWNDLKNADLARWISIGEEAMQGGPVTSEGPFSWFFLRSPASIPSWDDKVLSSGSLRHPISP